MKLVLRVFACFLFVSNLSVGEAQQLSPYGSPIPYFEAWDPTNGLEVINTLIDEINSQLSAAKTSATSAVLNLTQFGMLPGGQDNSPNVAAWMSAISPPTANVYTGIGTTVLPPPASPSTSNYWYFGSGIHLTRGGVLNCGDTAPQIGGNVILVAAGSDGIVNENNVTGGSVGLGNMEIDHCVIQYQGHVRSATASIGSSTVTGATLPTFGPIANPGWSSGDGIIMMMNTPWAANEATTLTNTAGATSTLTTASSFPSFVQVGWNPIDLTTSAGKPAYSPGSVTVTGCSPNGCGNSGNTSITLSGNITVAGASDGVYFVTPNFMVIANGAYIDSCTTCTGAATLTLHNFSGAATSSWTTANNSFTVSSCTGVINNLWVTDTTTSSAVGVVHDCTAGTLTLLSNAVSASSGSSDALSFSYAPITKANTGSPTYNLYQLPAAKAYTISTTSGSNSITVSAGSTNLVSGDWLWAPGIPFGSSIRGCTGGPLPGTPQTCGLYNISQQLAVNATDTLTSVSAWRIPSCINRRMQANATFNTCLDFPVGRKMSCVSSSPELMNCTTSYDMRNFYQFSMIGALATGDNTGASLSVLEEGATNSLFDFVESGSVGSEYIAGNSNSAEGSYQLFPFALNCVATNSSLFLGGYWGRLATQIPCFPLVSSLPSWGVPSLVNNTTYGGASVMVNPSSGWTASPKVGMSIFNGLTDTSQQSVTPFQTTTDVRSGTATNNDFTGAVTLSTGTGSYTFQAASRSTAPVCFVTDLTTPGTSVTASVTSTTLTLTGTGSHVIGYMCGGRN